MLEPSPLEHSAPWWLAVDHARTFFVVGGSHSILKEASAFFSEPVLRCYKCSVIYFLKLFYALFLYFFTPPDYFNDDLCFCF